MSTSPVAHQPTRGPRLATALRSVAAAGALIALGAVAACAPDQPTAATTVAEQGSAATAPQNTTSAAGPAASAPRQTQSGPLAAKAAAALRLARRYEQAGAHVSHLRPFPLYAHSPLARTLRRTANAYRIAAAAAAGHDLVSYRAAMSAAATGRQKAARLAAEPPRGARVVRKPSTRSGLTFIRPRPGCPGDSRSDDPSDDQCGGD
jgi:hypothetical protein